MNSFTQRYDSTVQKLDDQLSVLIDSGSEFDIEKTGDVLTVIFEDDSKFIITPNSPVNQLWVSANYEGHRFSFDEAKQQWLDEKSGEEFSIYLNLLFSKKLDKAIALSLG